MMAKGDCTIVKTFSAKPEWGGLKKAYFTATFDNYATGGYDFDLTVYGLGTIRFVGLPPTVLGFVPLWDEDNKKLKMYIGNYDSVTDGPLIEATDNDATLNSTTIKFEVVGTGV